MKRRPTIFINITIITLVLFFCMTAVGCWIFRPGLMDETAEEAADQAAADQAAADQAAADQAAAEAAKIEEERSIVSHLQLIEPETGYIVKDNSVRSNVDPFIGVDADGNPIMGIYSFSISEELLNRIISRFTLTFEFDEPIGQDMAEPDLESFFNELSGTDGSFDNYFVGPIPPQSYTISSDSSIWRISPETGERELIPRVKAASIGFDQLKKTTEIKVSDEAINALQRSIDRALRGTIWLFVQEYSGEILNQIAKNAFGAHYSVGATVESKPGEEASTEAAQIETEVIERMGFDMSEHPDYAGFEVTRVDDPLIGIEIGQIIFELNGLPLFDENHVNKYDANTATGMMIESMNETGSVTITRYDPNTGQTHLIFLRR